MWRQRAGTNQGITKDFLQDDIDKLITDEKITNKINSDKNSYKVNIEFIDEKDQSFLVSRNDFPAASIIIPINEKTPSIDFILLNTNRPKNHKPINNDKKTSKLKKFIYRQLLKMIKVTHLRIAFLINYIKILKIKKIGKWNHHLRKFNQSIRMSYMY